MSNDLDALLKEIQYKTGLTLDQVAESIGYSRPYLSKIRKKGAEMVIGKLKERFKAELSENASDDYGALLAVLISRVAELMSDKTGRSHAVETERIRSSFTTVS